MFPIELSSDSVWTFKNLEQHFMILTKLLYVKEKAPEAEGCAAGDREDREYMKDRGDRGKRGRRADWVNSFNTLSH